MNSLERKGNYVDPRQFKVGYRKIEIPVGSFALSLSRISSDETTLRGQDKTAELLENGPVYFDDFHAKRRDIAITAIELANIFDLEAIIAPVTVAHSRKWYLAPLVHGIQRVKGVELYEVGREEDFEGLDRKSKEFRELIAQTGAYKRRVQSAIKNKEKKVGIVIASSGTRFLKASREINSGVARDYRLGIPVVATYTATKKYPRFHTTYISDNPLTFNENDSIEKISADINNEKLLLLRQARRNK